MTQTAEAPQISLPIRYQLQAILKESPSTCVYRVFDVADKRDEAMKILRQEFSEQQELLQFKTEFTTLASLNHANIVKVYDFGLLDDRFPYFTMEYFAGRKLSDFFNGQNWEALYDLLLQIASALHHIHSLGIVHLDLKPSNILVDDAGRVKIMDFGVAAESRQIFDRRIRGTMHYMAPEVLRQDRIDGRADQYSLGMTFYETVTGALPTYGKPPIEIIRFHLEEEIRRPSAINPHIPEKLERIILKLLEKDPRHRYPSAAALLHDVAEAAGVKVPKGELLIGHGELLASPLIGRAAEIEQIVAAIGRARESNGNGVLIVGAEGSGKSRIVREATLRGQMEGARVFCGRCPVNRKSIYAPFFEIFQQIITAMNPDADAALEIRRILRPVVRGEGRGAPGQKFLLYNRIVQSLQDFYGFLNVSGTMGSPLVLVIEDLQWADPSTAELFTFLVGEARHSALTVIGTLTNERPIDAPVDESVLRLSAAWEQKAREAGVQVINLAPLDEEHVREYVEALLGEQNLPHEFVRWILWESGGSPLNIRRVVDYLIAHTFLTYSSGGWIADMDRIQSLRIPGGAGAIWVEKLESIGPTHQRVLQMASVVGEHFSVATLTRVVELPGEETYRIVCDLAAMNLLDESSSDTGSFAFPQMSLRERIYTSTPDRERALAHQRAACVFEEDLMNGASELLGEVAYHYARGTDPVKGIEYSIRAGEQAAIALGHEQAAEFYRIALELMDLSGHEARKPEIRENLGDAYYLSNNLRGAMQVFQFLLKSVQVHPEDRDAILKSAGIMKKIGKVLAKRTEWSSALTYFQNAMQIYQRLGTPLEVGEMQNRIAAIHVDKGDFVEAELSAAEAAKLIESTALASAHGYVKNVQGIIASARGDLARAETLFEGALEIAEKVGSVQLRKVTLTSLGNVLYKLGRWEEALDYFRRNLEQSENEGDLWDLVTSYNNVAMIEFSRGNFHSASALFERSLRIDEKLGASEQEASALEHLGESLEMVGRWTEARERFEQCLALQGFDESRPGRVSVYVPLARLCAKIGDMPKALRYAHRCFDAAERSRDESLMAEAAFVLAQIESERENFEEASRYIDVALSLFKENGKVHAVARALTFAADLAFRQQRWDEAASSAEEGARMARELGDQFTFAQGQAVLGKILFTKGEREAAEANFSMAHQIFDELETPYELGRLLFDIGLLREEPEDATQVLRRAVKIFERLEATPELERARGALFRIRPTGKGPDSSVVGLYEVVKIINSTLSVEEVLNRVLDIALRRLRAERGMILLIDPITSALRTRVARNIREGSEGGSKRSPQTIIREVIQTGHSVISADARSDERFVDSETVISENIVSTLCVPLVIKDRIAGAIYVDHRETRHLFSQRDLNFLEAFADQAAIAIENARLYEELEQARVRLSLENETLRKEVLQERHLDSVVGQSEIVARIQFTIKKAASSSSTVLIRGESGTGKGLIARIIHNVSSRRNGAFIKFNCAALPETLAESELFGHEKGAFTGADRRKLGRFELANGGTIFLDEIGKVSLAIQSKLLRVVEDKEFERVGGTQTIKTDVKIIAATNLEIEKAIELGTFREDLFYRLNIIPVFLPPLRERKEDIPVLSEHFIRKICKDLGVDPKRLEPGILELFDSYHWPGNVRELEATLHRAIVMSSGDLMTRSEFYSLLPGGGTASPSQAELAPLTSIPRELLNPMVKRLPITGGVYDDVMSSVDRQLIEQALQETGGKIRETARRLGLARNTLKAKLQKYNISARGE
ncbi:MAG TPA: sigma 54-interacting transcriptional regulator [Thermoanaerobaculia bacterium]|nr:sigma 54-interacting transcriptional regulator [Thermoanaerobaculia bacterium]